MSKKNVYTDIDLNANSLLNGGFEAVSSLPQTNLFKGRQVMYQNLPYWYNGSEWITVPVGLFWSLTQSNAENGVIPISLVASSDSIFPQITPELKNKSRTILCDIESRNGITDLFGDLANCLPNVRYEIYLHANNDCSIQFSENIVCNISRFRTGNPYPTTFRMLANDWAKIEFVKIEHEKQIQVVFADIECVTFSTVNIYGSNTDTSAGDTTTETLNDLETENPANGLFYFKPELGSHQPYLIANDKLQPTLYQLVSNQKDKDISKIWQASDGSNKIAINLNDLFEILLNNK